MTIDKLPAWSNFWQEMRDTMMPLDPEVLKASLTSIEEYDIQTTEFVSNVKKRFDYFFHGRWEFRPRRTTTTPGKEMVLLTDGESMFKTISGILQGPHDLRSELEFINSCLTEELHPKIVEQTKFLEQLIDKEEFHDKRQSLLEAVEFGESMIKRNEAIQQWAHCVLTRQPEFERDGSTRQNVGATLANVLDYISMVNAIFDDMENESVLEGQ
jgi:hypothetical protein